MKIDGLERKRRNRNESDSSVIKTNIFEWEKAKTSFLLSLNFLSAMLMPKHVERQNMCQKALKHHISNPQMGWELTCS